MCWLGVVLMLLAALFAGANTPASLSAVGTLKKAQWTTGGAIFVVNKGADETHGLITMSSGTTVTDFKHSRSSNGSTDATFIEFSSGAGVVGTIRATIDGGSTWATLTRNGTVGAYYYEVANDPLNLGGLTNGQTVSFSIEDA